ncbi:hypothetical protein AGLY_011094 [Aphis glycines]|uniref:Uncharacterized protein n=1 Tax=Aphis glycines TaxID=307491 RepID=A0A6G0TCW0_APHGL|nr:hypothetical protein AGLY_011094 [Aphis glycines]
MAPDTAIEIAVQSKKQLDISKEEENDYDRFPLFAEWFLGDHLNYGRPGPRTSANKSDDKGGEDGGIAGSVVSGEGTTLSPSLLDRVIVVMYSIKQQASKTLNRAGSAASVLNRLQPGTTKQTLEVGGIGLRAPEKKLPSGENTLGRLQETKGRTVAATKKVVDETIHKLQSTVNDIGRTISSDDLDDVSGERRRSSSLDSLFWPWTWRGPACDPNKLICY